MSKQRILVAFHVIALIAVVVLSVGLTFVMMGCGHSNKVSNEDIQIARLQHLVREQADLFANLQTIMGDLNAAIEQLEASLELATASQTATQQQLNALEAQQADLQNTQTQIEIDLHAALVQIAELQGYVGIIGLVDPCGDAAGKIDEVLVQLSTGQYLASFSDSASGTNTRFSLLQNGNYSTTDGTNCHFSLQNGVLVW